MTGTILNDKEIDRIADFTCALYQWASGRTDHSQAIETLGRIHSDIHYLLKKSEFSPEAVMLGADPGAKFLWKYLECMESAHIGMDDLRKPSVISPEAFQAGLELFREERKKLGKEGGPGAPYGLIRELAVDQMRATAAEREKPVGAEDQKSAIKQYIGHYRSIAQVLKRFAVEEGTPADIDILNVGRALAAAVVFEKDLKPQERASFVEFLDKHRTVTFYTGTSVEEALAGLGEVLKEKDVGDSVRKEINKKLRGEIRKWRISAVPGDHPR